MSISELKNLYNTQKTDYTVNNYTNTNNNGLTASSIWDTLNNTKTGNNNENSTKIENLLTQIFNFLKRLASGIADAKRETEKNSKDAKNLDVKQEELKHHTEMQITDIAKNILENSKTITQKQEDLENTQTKLEKQKEELNKTLQQIQEKQEALKNATSSDDMQAILGEIKTLNENMTTILSEISGLEEIVKSLTEKVLECTENINSENEKAEDVTQTSEQASENIAKEYTEEVAGNTETIGKGAKNKKTAMEGNTLAVAASTNFVTAPEAPKIKIESNKQAVAGNTRITKSTQTLAILSEGIGRIASDLNVVISNCKTAVGNTYNDASDIIGGYNSVLTPFVTSIGSLQTGINTTKQELNSAIEKDEQTLENTAKDTDDKAINNRTKVGKENGTNPLLNNDDNNENNKIELETPKVKIELL